MPSRRETQTMQVSPPRLQRYCRPCLLVWDGVYGDVYLQVCKSSGGRYTCYLPRNIKPNPMMLACSSISSRKSDSDSDSGRAQTASQSLTDTTEVKNRTPPTRSDIHTYIPYMGRTTRPPSLQNNIVHIHTDIHTYIHTYPHQPGRGPKTPRHTHQARICAGN